MRAKNSFIFLFMLFLSMIIVGNLSAQQRKYVGTGKCKMCHKKAADGNQYAVWKKSSHAKAYQTLAGDKAKAYGKKLGIDNPQKSDKCLKCHVTAYNVDKKYLGKKYKVTDGVSCESCHGAGGDYYKKKTMTGIASKKIKAASVGLNTPDEKTCKTCHNDESPAFKGFDFKKYYAKIKHPIISKKK